MTTKQGQGSEFGFFRKPLFPLLILTGASRTGKTTLARLLAQQENFEFIDEPWLPMFLPVVVDRGLCDEATAKALLATYFDELCNDVVLLRRANFRPSDLSSVWKFKSAESIFDRLTNLKSREDVGNWVAQKSSVLVVCLPEITPFISFFTEAIDNVKVVNVVRDAKELAAEIESKQWFSTEQLTAPKNNQPYCRYQCDGVSYYLPWWLPENQYDSFITGSEGYRAEVYADIFEGFSKGLGASIDTQGLANVIQVRSEEIFCGDDRIPDNVSSFLASE